MKNTRWAKITSEWTPRDGKHKRKTFPTKREVSSATSLTGKSLAHRNYKYNNLVIFYSLVLSQCSTTGYVRLLSLTPLMLIPASMFILLKISSTAVVNITGDIVSPWRTPFMIFIFPPSFSVPICAVPSAYVSLMMLMYFSCTPCTLSVSNLLYVGWSQRPFRSPQKPCTVDVILRGLFEYLSDSM